MGSANKSALCFVLVLGLALAATAAKPEKYIQVTSPHFQVISNGSAKDARRVAGQLERMRTVFRTMFPGLAVDPAIPIEVLAIRGQQDFQSLLPAAYLGKGKLRVGGYFQRGQERNYIAMRLDTGNQAHPYEIIYHEYTHLLTARDADFMPLWLNEGLAQFYQETEISGDDVSVGMPDQQALDALRRNPKWIPLPVLFKVDVSSPYYHQEDKGSQFYAESWFVTHDLMVLQSQQHRQLIANYLQLIRRHVGPVAAARQAFGDLDRFQSQLDQTMRNLAMVDFHLKIADAVQEKSYPSQPVPTPEADAVRADFIAHVGRYNAAESLLQAVLRADPNNVRAREALGYIATRQNHMQEAENWYAQAVKLNSKDFLAQYFFGALKIRNAATLDAATAARVETSLRLSIALNPNFAPAYDRLAVVEMEQNRDLPQARRQELKAIQLDPTELTYRFNLANVLMAMQQFSAAVQVLQDALPLTKTSPDLAREGRDRLLQAQRMAQSQKYPQAAAAGLLAPAKSAPGAPRPIATTGTVTAVRCHQGDALDLDLRVNGKSLTLHSNNYYGITFTSDITIHGVFEPCIKMRGLRVRVTSAAGNIRSIRLLKK